MCIRDRSQFRMSQNRVSQVQQFAYYCGGSGVAATACTRMTVSPSDGFNVGEAGTAGLADSSTRSFAILGEVEFKRLDGVGVSTFEAPEVNHWGKS